MPQRVALPATPPPDGGPADDSILPALRRLARVDRDLARAWRRVGPLPERRWPPGFATLLKIIISQQLSVAAADTIFRRLGAAAQPFTAGRVLSLRRSRLKACGLSGPKIDYCRAAARAVAEGALDLDRLARLDDAQAVAALTEVRGIGRWSAEIYLLFALGRADIWPAQDLALQVAVQDLKGLAARPGARDMDRLAESWRPHRGVAARLLWRYYRVSRARPVP